MDYRLSGQRIFLVEDDLMLGESLSEILQAQGAEVNWHKNAERVMSCLQTSSYDLMILDIGLPKISGFELLAQLREMQQDLPVLILSARDMIQDLSELLARVRVLIRRRCGRAQSKIKVGEVCLDPNAHQVFYLGQLVNLSRQEYRLLKLLMENIGGVITRDRLEIALLDKEELESNALEVHIHHLRKKIFPEFIRTIRGVGYIVQVEI